jgi:hypothetical protein
MEHFRNLVLAQAVRCSNAGTWLQLRSAHKFPQRQLHRGRRSHVVTCLVLWHHKGQLVHTMNHLASEDVFSAIKFHLQPFFPATTPYYTLCCATCFLTSSQQCPMHSRGVINDLGL